MERAITPFNFPHQINLAKAGSALAAGDTVVLKPARRPMVAMTFGGYAVRGDSSQAPGAGDLGRFRGVSG